MPIKYINRYVNPHLNRDLYEVIIIISEMIVMISIPVNHMIKCNKETYVKYMSLQENTLDQWSLIVQMKLWNSINVWLRVSCKITFLTEIWRNVVKTTIILLNIYSSQIHMELMKPFVDTDLKCLKIYYVMSFVLSLFLSIL